MRLITFDALRCLDIPGTRYIKPELMFRHKDEIKEADWVLFPEYWQVNSLAYSLQKRIFPSLGSYHLGHDKIEMTRAFWGLCPEQVPHTVILPATSSAKEEVLDVFTFPFIAKEVRNSMGRGVHLIESRAEFDAYCRHNDILYIQEYLPIRRDLRVVYVGEEIIGAYWRNGREGDYRNNVARGARIDYEDVPQAALDLVVRVAHALNINHAGFDVAVIGDCCYLLEFNTLFGSDGLRRRNISVGKYIWEFLQKHTPQPTLPPNFRLSA
jgi:ribosomal protein S6--L-glutamate ligase